MIFTDSQKKAISDFKDKNICVAAGAGSGKTLVLVERFIERVTKDGLLPDEILAITFTEKAANQMKERLISRLRHSDMQHEAQLAENGYISTRHSI